NEQRGITQGKPFTGIAGKLELGGIYRRPHPWKPVIAKNKNQRHMHRQDKRDKQKPIPPRPAAFRGGLRHRGRRRNRFGFRQRHANYHSISVTHRASARGRVASSEFCIPASRAISATRTNWSYVTDLSAWM